jgi:predicted Zn finger-like uncharacterized protein
MDVRCERCRAQYVFDDEQVTPAGLTVQCTNCGHVFRVKKKELVVTVAVKPEEMDAAPVPASSIAPRPAGAPPAAADPPREPAREWHVRQASGNVFTFRELTTLQKWIIERKVARDDEISRSGEQWKRLGDIAELASFFQVVEAAERGRAPAGTPVAVPAVPAFRFPPPAPAPYPPPPSGYPPPSFTMPPPAQPPRPAPSRPAAAAHPEVEVDLGAEHGHDDSLGPEELAAVGKGRGRRVALLLVLLVAATGAGAYAFAPQLFRGRSGELAPAVPAAIEGKPEPLPPAAISPAPEPAAAAAAAPEAPAPAPAPPGPAPERASGPAEPHAKPKPLGPVALLARAAKLREKGDTEAALDLYGEVATDEPDNVEALTGRGLCYLDLERYPPAEASFQAALQVDPRQPDALLGLAEAYRWQGKRTDAIRYYERVLAVSSQGEDAEVARNALEELRK